MGGATFTSVPPTPVTSGIQTFLVKIFHLPLEVIVLIVPILTFLVRAW
jgi:cytochrome b561